MRVAEGSVSMLLADTLVIDADNGAKLDLGDNSAVFVSTPQPAIQALILRARNGGSWDGPGIGSSAAKDEQSPQISTLAVLSGSEYIGLIGPGATFNSHTVAPNDVLVKFTFYGDTDLNGVVNFDDYARIDNGFNNGLSSWLYGDFDYNGVVNFDDYALIDLAFNSQAPRLQSIPEPAALLSVAVAVPLFLARRRRAR
jgi:hypothetical protein